MRKYYAFYAAYGINVAYGEYHPAIVHVFYSKKERDKWVEDSPINSQMKREIATAREARKYAKDYNTWYHNDDGTVTRWWE